MMKPAIEIRNLGKQYKLATAQPYIALRDVVTSGIKNIFSGKKKNEQFWALKDIDLDIMPGERLGIIGRNGAGKSTLLKIISRITPPTTGSAIIRGRVGSLLEVGTGFHPELTGRENIYLNGSILGLQRTEIHKKLDEIIDFSGVEKFIDTPLKHYSSGMQLRLAFSVAAHLEPEILLIDEVLSVGDLEFQKKCIGKMEEVSKTDGRTIVFVSHDLLSIQHLCNKGVLLQNGMIHSSGEMNKVISDYRSSIAGPETSLADRTDRMGSGNIRLTGIRVKDQQQLSTGNSLSVEISYSAIKENLLPSEFGISIWDSNESKLISISSTFKDQLHSFGSTGKVTCEIPALPLVNGRYFLNAFVSSIFGVEDYIEKIMEIEVHENDVFGHGKTVDPRWGKIVVEHNWTQTK
jgi:lipopolysaccharide transport system ATP-binding protein